MKMRMLLLIPVALAVNIWIFKVGPYSELTESLGAAMLPEQRPLAPANDFVTLISSLTSEQCELYARHLVWDIGLIAGNTLILVALIGVAVRRLALRSSFRVCLYAIAAAPGMFDLIENALTAALLARHAAPPPMLASANSFVVGLKFGSLALALATAILLWVQAGVRRLRSSAKPAMQQTASNQRSPRPTIGPPPHMRTATCHSICWPKIRRQGLEPRTR